MSDSSTAHVAEGGAEGDGILCRRRFRQLAPCASRCHRRAIDTTPCHRRPTATTPCHLLPAEQEATLSHHQALPHAPATAGRTATTMTQASTGWAWRSCSCSLRKARRKPVARHNDATQNVLRFVPTLNHTSILCLDVSLMSRGVSLSWGSHCLVLRCRKLSLFDICIRYGKWNVMLRLKTEQLFQVRLTSLFYCNLLNSYIPS